MIPITVVGPARPGRRWNQPPAGLIYPFEIDGRSRLPAGVAFGGEWRNHVHPEFQQLLWIAGFVTVAPFLFGAAALLFGGSDEPPEGAPTGAGPPTRQE